MIGTTCQVFDIEAVRTVDATNGTPVVTFESGLVARVPQDHPDRDKIIREAQRSLQDCRPVGVMLNGDGRVVDLNAAHQTTVRSVLEDEDNPGRLAIWCWEFSPVCYLSRDHPEFDRIKAALQQAAASRTRVWLANRTHLVHDETEIWWKILDVRPVSALPSVS